jgi:DNA-binding CsgD family transcriptional regulator
LRAATLRFEARREAANGDIGVAFDSPASQAVGVLNLDHAGRVTRYTPAADHLLRELGAPEAGRRDERGLPMAVWAVVGALRRALGAGPDPGPSQVPCLRVRARSGGWLTLQTSLTEPWEDGSVETVVAIAPAGPAEMVQLQTTAHGLSAREKEVVDLIVRGFSTRQISKTLYISESTVQGHLSHVFEKVGVKSRGELLKRLFLDNLSLPA